MDYEQKYRKLVDAIKVMRDVNPSDEGLQNWVQDNVPELAKSEDERIKEELIDAIQGLWDNDALPLPLSAKRKESWIAWLEKQGDKDKLIKELGKYKVKYTQEVLEKHLNSMNNKDSERLRKTTIAFLKEFADKGYENAVECIDWLEKQSKKTQGKTALEAVNEEKFDNSNKVEPKFNVGDWIASNIYNPAKIMCIDGDSYEIEFIDGSKDFPHIDYIDGKFHLWTIDDAKDGDILSNGKMIVIFKKFEEPPYRQGIIAYIGLDIGGDFQITDGTWQLGVGQVRPATKEERDTLFAKMKEYGLEWDAENKLLKKIISE